METEIRVIESARYEAQFRDVERFEKLCKRCGNYDNCWICPPFRDSDMPDFDAYENIAIIACRLQPDASVAPSEVMDSVRDQRLAVEKRLLEWERLTGGRAFGFSGQCPYCASCSRKEKGVCRHPDKARAPLEAFGFDLCLTMEDLFGRRLEWSFEGEKLSEITLIGALLYNGELPDNGFFSLRCDADVLRSDSGSRDRDL